MEVMIVSKSYFSEEVKTIKFSTAVDGVLFNSLKDKS